MRVCRKQVFSQSSGFVHTGRSPAVDTDIIGSSPVVVAVAIALNTNIVGASRSTPDVKVQRARGSMNDISTSTL